MKRLRYSRVGGFSALILGVVLIGVPPVIAEDETIPPGGHFWDDDGNISEGAIESIVGAGIMKGCNSPYYDMFCPEWTVSRGEAAQVLRSAFDVSERGSNTFVDTVGKPYLSDISALTSAGVMTGCSETEFCPEEDITREELAEVFARFLDLTDIRRPLSDMVGASGDSAAAVVSERIMLPCDLDSWAFCPNEPVTRGELASFVLRALDMRPTYPPPAQVHMLSRFTTYHPCCQERVWAVHHSADLIDGVIIDPHRVFSMLEALDGGVRDGYCQTATTLFNAFYWAALDEVDHLPHDYNFIRYPDALEATLIPRRQDLKFRNDTKRPVEIRAYYTTTSITVEIWGDNDGRVMEGDYSPERGYVMEAVEEGGSAARIVSSEVERIGPRKYRATRTITENGISESESWEFRYNTGY